MFSEKLNKIRAKPQLILAQLKLARVINIH